MPETRAALTESNTARAAEPVAAALALLSPRGLGRLSCSSRLWRDAAAKVGAPLHVYAISSHSSDITPGIYGGEVLRDYEFMGDLEHRGLVDRVLGPHVSTRPPSAGEKQEFAEFMNTLADHERALNFRCMFGRTLDRDQLSALQAEAKFTVPLLDGMEVLQLNTWREMMRREDWEEIPAPAGEA